MTPYGPHLPVCLQSPSKRGGAFSLLIPLHQAGRFLLTGSAFFDIAFADRWFVWFPPFSRTPRGKRGKGSADSHRVGLPLFLLAASLSILACLLHRFALGRGKRRGTVARRRFYGRGEQKYVTTKKRSLLKDTCHLARIIRGECDVCGQPASLHMPMKAHGWYCGTHCPVCKALASGTRASLRRRPS